MMRVLLRPLGLILALCIFAFAATVQSQEAPDYDAWRGVADRATEAISAGRASDTALQELRDQLDGWRDIFRNGQSVNASAIATVQSQLDSLGAVPEDGAESADIAAQRSDLNRRLATLQTPVRAANVAFTEAVGLIGGIDDILRERQTTALLELGPTPINPVIWPEGLESLLSTYSSTRNEVSDALTNTVKRETLQQRLPQVLVLAVIGLVLLTQSGRLVARFTRLLQTRVSSVGGWIIASIVSVGQVFLPFLGVLSLVEAANATQLAGLRGDILLTVLPRAGFIILLSIWLGERTFPKGETFLPFIRLPESKRGQGRRLAVYVGLILAANLILTAFADYEVWSADAKAVIFFPLFVLAALVLWRLSVLMRAQEIDEDGPNYGDRLLSALARVLVAVAILTVAIAAIGYFNAAQRLIIPSLQTLHVLALLMLLQRFATAGYMLVTGAKDNASESLIPVLIGFILVIAALPMLALIWGARQSELSELWSQFVDGIAIGETRIAPADVITFLFIFLGGLAITRLLQGTMRNTILPRTQIDIGGQNAIVSGLGYVGIFLASLVAINSTGLDLSNIALVASALSVGIGFGLQTVVSNFVSGIILLIERPISEGDWIEVNGHTGYVRNISVRSTRIETFDRTDVIVPNADLVSGTVTNFTRGNTIGRVIVPVGVAYGTDPRRIEKILLEIANDHPMVLANPAPYVVFQGFGASSLDFEIRAILRDVNWVLSVRSQMNFSIAERFMAENIEIPFAQRDIWLRNPEALTGSTAETEAPTPKRTDRDRPAFSARRLSHPRCSKGDGLYG